MYNNKIVNAGDPKHGHVKALINTAADHLRYAMNAFHSHLHDLHDPQNR